MRIFVFVVPAVAGALAAWAATRLLPDPSALEARVAWWVVVIGAAVAAVLVAEVLARRLLPLAWLLRLTLAFPDRVPSRLATARRAAAGRRALHRSVSRARAEGLGDDAGAAAEQALVLVAALGAHDRRTRGHSERVRALADVLAAEIGVHQDDRDRLRWAALLHDIGKLTVPGEILNKPDRPDEEEWATLRRHPAEGGRLVGPLAAWLGPWADAVAQHHERWDGGGYPRGLTGEEISLGGRILSVVDAYEVMTAVRPYKQPLRPDVARRELVAGSGSHFDPELVRRFLGISLGRLWWAVGGTAALSMVPAFFGRLWTTPAGAQTRRGVSGPVTAAVAVAALTLGGVVVPPGEPTAVRPPAGDRTEVAAPGAGAGEAPVPPPDPAADAAPSGSPSAPPPSVVPAVSPGPGPAAGGIAPGAPTGPVPSPVVPAVLPALPVAPAAPGAGAPEGAPPADDPADPAIPPAPPRYAATGVTFLPGLLGLTGLELSLTCSPPLTQGVDAVVFDLPAEARVGGAPVRVTAGDGATPHALDAVFYSESCEVLGRITGGAEAAGTLPVGTRFVAVTDRSGILTTVEIVVR